MEKDLKHEIERLIEEKQAPIDNLQKTIKDLENKQIQYSKEIERLKTNINKNQTSSKENTTKLLNILSEAVENSTDEEFEGLLNGTHTLIFCDEITSELFDCINSLICSDKEKFNALKERFSGEEAPIYCLLVEFISFLGGLSEKEINVLKEGKGEIILKNENSHSQKRGLGKGINPIDVSSALLNDKQLLNNKTGKGIHTLFPADDDKN